MKISDPMHLDVINIITKYYLSRFDREGNVVTFVNVKLMKIFKIKIFVQKSNHIISATSDQNLMVNGSLDSSRQGATNRSIFISFGPMNVKLFAKVSKQ